MQVILFYIYFLNGCYIYIYAFSRRFYPKRLTIAFRLYIFVSICVPWDVLVRICIAVYHFVILHIWNTIKMFFFWMKLIQKGWIKLIKSDSKDISEKEFYFK